MNVLPGGEHWAAGIGKGFGEGIAALAEHKFKKLEERHKNREDVERLTKNNVPRPIANLIASYPENQRLQALATFGELGLLGNQQQQQQTQQLQQQAITPQEQQAVGLQDVFSALNPRSAANPQQRQLSQLLAGPQQNPFQQRLGGMPQFGQGGGQESIAQQVPEKPVQAPAPVRPRVQEESPMVVNQPTRKAPEIERAVESVSKIREKFDEANATRAKEELTEAVNKPSKALSKAMWADLTKSQEKLRSARVETLRNETIDTLETSKNSTIPSLKRMRQLNDSGKVVGQIPGFLNNVFKGLTHGAINLTGFFGKESEEFYKLSEEFIKQISAFFPGSRINIPEVQAFMNTVPTLLQSKDGRDAVIRNMLLLEEAKQARGQALQKITKDFGGMLPPNTDDLIGEYAREKLDKIADQFISGNVVWVHPETGEEIQLPVGQEPPARKQRSAVGAA